MSFFPQSGRRRVLVHSRSLPVAWERIMTVPVQGDIT